LPGITPFCPKFGLAGVGVVVGSGVGLPGKYVGRVVGSGVGLPGRYVGALVGSGVGFKYT
jgi:hypothetical protein